MRVPSRFLSVVALAFTLSLVSCDRGIFGQPEYVAVTIAPRPTSAAVGTAIVLTGTVSNPFTVPVWGLLYSADAPNVGTLTPISGSPNSILYTAPAAPPIYSAAVGAGFQQGTVTVTATVSLSSAAGSVAPGSDSVTVIVTAPSITVGISPISITVPRGTTQYFSGYAVGNVNSQLIWQVNGVTGGSSTTGSISSAGVYAAPAAFPMTGTSVTVTVISQADPTKTASALVTLD